MKTPHPKARGAPQTYPADQARQGEIILRTRLRRIIFLAGLVGAVVVALLVEFLARRAA